MAANKKNNVTLKVIPNEVNLTDLKDLLKKSEVNKRKENKKGIIIGYIIVILGIISLISSILINRLVDREYFPDSTIIFIIGVSIFSLIFGFYIVTKEIR